MCRLEKIQLRSRLYLTAFLWSRDLKPENLLITSDGHLKLTDFGTARFNVEEVGPAVVTLSRTGKETTKRAVSFVGTADYIAPEVLDNTSCTPAVDLWSLGCVIYQLTCGQPPFRCSPALKLYSKLHLLLFWILSSGTYINC